VDVEDGGGAESKDFDDFELGGKVISGGVSQPALAWAYGDWVVGHWLFQDICGGLECGGLETFGNGEIEGAMDGGLENGWNDRSEMVSNWVGVISLLFDVQV
jgi:hypothetical protein